MINDWCLGIIQVQQAIYLVLSTCCFIWTTAKPFGRSTDETVCCWGELHYSLKWHANANFQLAQAGFPFSLHTSLTFLSSLFSPPSICLSPAGSSVISCISCFFLSFGNSESAMIALLCLFGGISIASWNALDVLTVELYPSDKR